MISSNFYLPFKFVVNTNYENVEEEKEYTKDEAKEQAVNEAKRKLENKVGKNEGIVNEYINTNEGTDYIEVEVVYEVLEDIGTEEKLSLWKDEYHGGKKLKSLWYGKNIFF